MTRGFAKLGVVAVGLLAAGCSSAESTAADELGRERIGQLTAPLAPADVTLVTGPGTAFSAAGSVFDLAAAGYVEEEYFVSGTAVSYARTGAWGVDGVWNAAPATSAPFRTRILVRRPADKTKFRGTVVAEWMNVSSGWDIPHHWMYAHDEIMREGHAWVGVSTQVRGVQFTPFALKNWNPTRYGSLSHPGDAYAYDIFTQVAGVLRDDKSTVLGGLKVERVLAAGFSQSANGLATYANAIQPLTAAFDGFLIHGRSSTALALGGAPPAGATIRTDLAVPVMSIEDEFMVTNGAWLNRQPDNEHFRLWEIAGTAHVDGYANLFADPTISRDLHFPPLFCVKPQNAAPLHWVVKSALHGLVDWIAHDRSPAHAPSSIQVSGGAVVRDAYGNAVGGVRLPQLEVPRATYLPTGNFGAPPCALAGVTQPFAADTLQALYPTDDVYADAFNKAINTTRQDGFVLRPEAQEAKKALGLED